MGSFNLRKQLLTACTIYIGQILVGFGMGWGVPIMFKLEAPEESPLAHRISYTTLSWVNSCLYIGYIIGPFFTGCLSNIVGRKPCLLIGGIITAISFLLAILTYDPIMIFVTRILQGFGIGIIAVGNIVYLGEIASTNIRGILLTAIGIASNLGFLLIYAIGPYVSFAGTGWVGFLLSLMYVGAGLFIPETPIFFLIKENEDEAKRLLNNLGRADEVNEILATKQEKEVKTKTTEWKELFTVRSNRRALIMLLTLGIFQQFSGLVAMTYFTPNIFNSAGLSVSPHLATLIIGVARLGASCLTPILVESFGRRNLLLISTSVCCVMLGRCAFVSSVSWLPLTVLIVYFIFYELGFGIIPSTLTGEMFRSNIRSVGTTVILTMTWLVGFGVSSAFHYMLSVSVLYSIYLFFSAICACATIFTAFYVPETKGKSLLEIQEMLEMGWSIINKRMSTVGISN